MKKKWNVLLVLIAILLILSQQTTSFAQYNQTNTCKSEEDRNKGLKKLSSTHVSANEENIKRCINNTHNSNDWCCVCFENTPPTVCSELLNALTPSPSISIKEQLIDTPTPTMGNSITTRAAHLQIYLTNYQTNTRVPIITPLPTYTSIPTKPIDTPTHPPSAANPVQNEEIIPSSIPTIVPTQQLAFPSLPMPTERLIPKNLSTKIEKEESKTMTQLDTTVLTEIKIAPPAPVPTPTDKPILSEEQTKLAFSQPSPSLSNGILVTLEQKTGNSYVTQQDELLVKRGNQFFSISNQAPSSSQTQNSKSKIATMTEVPQLEINANNVIALSSMGLSVDPLSGILTVQTPTGPQKVSIMPDEALGIVVELKALNARGVVNPSILLVSENGALIYRISGEKVEKFLGLFPLPIQKQILISADTGSVVKVELSHIAQILSFFTF